MCSYRISPHSLHSLHRRNWKFLGSKNFQKGEEKMWMFSGITQWIFLLVKGGGGGVEGLDLRYKKGVKLFLR